MQSAGKQAALNFHQLAVHRTHEGITTIEIHGGSIELRQFDVLVEIALPCGLHDRVHDLNTATSLAKLLIGANQLTQFFQPPVQASVFCWWGEIADGGCVTTPLGNRRL